MLVDRKGNESLALPRRDRYNNPRLSPDGARVSVDIRSANSLGDVWVFEIGRSGGPASPPRAGATSAPNGPPTASELILQQRASVLRSLSSRGGREQPARSAAQRLVRPLHRFGLTRRKAGRVFTRGPGGEIWTIPLQGASTATKYFANGFNLGHPTLSPDGRWMAYDSDESGQGVDVFIQSFPDPRVKRVKVSPAHGSEPMWTQGGRELVYREGDKVMAVSVDLGDRCDRSAAGAFFGTVSRQPRVDAPAQLRCHAG